MISAGRIAACLVFVCCLLASPVFASDVAFEGGTFPDFLRWYAGYAGKNVVYAGELDLPVYVYSEQSANFDAIFRSVVASVGCEIREDANVINVLLQVDSKKGIASRLKNSEELENLEFHHFTLEHREAVEVVPVLARLYPKSRVVQVAFDAVAVVGEDVRLVDLADWVARVDIPAVKILIEAVIVETSNDTLQQIETFLTSGALSAGAAGGKVSLRSDGILARGLELVLTYNNNLRGLVSLLEAHSDTKILSTPRLVTVSGAAAKIIVGQNVPVLTGRSTGAAEGASQEKPFQTIARQDVGVMLSVVPVVVGGRIMIDVVQTASSVTESNTAVDIVTDKRSISSRLDMVSGETVVLGGLVSDKKVNRRVGIPFISHIPIIGKLFSGFKDQVVQRNLTVFLKCTIV